MSDITTTLDKKSAENIGFIQGPDESDEQYKQRIEYCLTHQLAKSDSYLFGWIPLIYSNKGLSLFEVGTTWIEDTGPFPYPIIQLRKSFKTNKKWFFYSKEEVLKHELIHAKRVCFHEPKFEEFIAYTVSKNLFRKLFGPIFQNHVEPFFFLISGLATCFFYMHPIIFSFGLLGISFFIGRLLLRHIIFHKALRKHDYQLNALLSFTDKEIQKCK